MYFALVTSFRAQVPNGAIEAGELGSSPKLRIQHNLRLFAAVLECFQGEGLTEW